MPLDTDGLLGRGLWHILGIVWWFVGSSVTLDPPRPEPPALEVNRVLAAPPPKSSLDSAVLPEQLIVFDEATVNDYLRSMVTEGEKRFIQPELRVGLPALRCDEELEGLPEQPRLWHLKETKTKALVEQTELWLHQGIVAKADSHQVALGTILPVVAVRKSGGGYRFALDLRAINAKIKRPDFAHLLDVTYITRKASEFRVLGRLDCTAAFLNVELSKALQQHCHYRVGNNLYRFLRMPFGLKTATGHWQRFLSLLLHEIDPSVTSKAEWWPTSRSTWMTL